MDDKKGDIIYAVLDSDRRLVSLFDALDKAVDLCSKRHHFVHHGVWRNVRNETAFHDYIIIKLKVNTFPSLHEPLEFDLLPEDDYVQDINDLKTLKQQVIDRAKTAEASLKSIERIMEEERGEDWTRTLNDKEYDVLVLFEDAMYEESMYEPWGVETPPTRRIGDFLKTRKRLQRALSE